MYSATAEIFAIVVITVVGMGRGDHVGDAVGSGGVAHGNRDLPGFRPVIDFRKDVRVNVDHDSADPKRDALSVRFNQIRGQRPRDWRERRFQGQKTLTAEDAEKTAEDAEKNVRRLLRK